MLFGVGVSCRILYSIVSIYMKAVASKLLRLGKRDLICQLSFTCMYVVSVRRGFLFPLVLWLCCVILLWHFLGLPYSVWLFLKMVKIYF